MGWSWQDTPAKGTKPPQLTGDELREALDAPPPSEQKKESDAIEEE